jgi:hypothetical protein
VIHAIQLTLAHTDEGLPLVYTNYIASFAYENQAFIFADGEHNNNIMLFDAHIGKVIKDASILIGEETK